MTTFEVHNICREHGEGSSKIGGVEGASFNAWWSMGERDPLEKGKGGVWGRDTLEKGKYLANSYTAARVNVYYKLSNFFPMLF